MGRITDWNGTGYVYDSFGRLISAKDGKGRGWSYEYDSVGNITRSVYSDGTGTAEEKYTYGRGGNLMTFGNERTGGYKGGNPGLYLGNKLTWTRGRQLSSVKHKNKKSAHSVSEDISYTYTHEGIRLSKTVGETKTEYILDGSTILAEKRGNEVLNYYYSSDGRLLEIGYTKDSSKADALENHYTILRNAMGDVAGLLTPDGTLVGTYEYDPYGRLISITHSNSYTDTDGILERNPFRYRGYYYDNETGWYYLQSRYYDPEVKRFINADTPDLLTNDFMNLMQYNLFMYCNGDPVNGVDPSGNITITIKGSANANIILGVAVDFDISFDFKHNIAFQYSYAIPGVDNTMSFGFIDAGIAPQLQITNAETVNDLLGIASYIGASASPKTNIGLDLLQLEPMNSTRNTFDGIQLTGLGWGLGLDVHLIQSITRNLYWFPSEF